MRVVLTTRFASPQALRARLAIEQAMRQSPVGAAHVRRVGWQEPAHVVTLRPATAVWRSLGTHELTSQRAGTGEVTLLVGQLAELIEVAMFLETERWEPVIASVTEPTAEQAQ